MEIAITRDMAINLYAAIAIDTGTFRYGNTTAETLKAAAELIEAGASPACISHNLYETWSKERFDLLVMALNTYEMIDDVVITFVTREMFQKTGTAPEDTENFPAFPRIMQNVNTSVFFRSVFAQGEISMLLLLLLISMAAAIKMQQVTKLDLILNLQKSLY
jgi:phosphoesterase RecJ-like protein